MARISKNDLLKLQKKLFTDAKIGEEFGITRQAVHQLRKKYDIESRTAGNPDRNKEMLDMRSENKTVEAISKKFKLSIPQTYRILKESNPKKPVAKKAVKAPAPVAKKAVKAVAPVTKKAPAPIAKKAVKAVAPVAKKAPAPVAKKAVKAVAPVAKKAPAPVAKKAVKAPAKKAKK